MMNATERCQGRGKEDLRRLAYSKAEIGAAYSWDSKGDGKTEEFGIRDKVD